MKISGYKKKEVLYSKSIQILKDKLNGRIEIGYKLIGDIKMGMDGKWCCLIEKEINFTDKK